MVGHHKGYCLLFYYILITNLKNENSLNLKKMYYTSKCILFQSNQIRKLTRISGMLHSLKHFQSFFLGTDFRSSSTSHTRNSVSYFIVATPIWHKTVSPNWLLNLIFSPDFSPNSLNYSIWSCLSFPKIQSALKG